LSDSGRIDPEVATFVDRVQRDFARHAGLAQMSFPQQRAVAEQVRAPWRQGGPAMARTWDRTVSTPAGEVRLRLFDPGRPAGPGPALVYLHGGGFTTFSLDTHDRLMREYAARAGLLVIGVDYALSPEARFPVALDQVTGVLDWLFAGGEAVGVDPRRIAVGGDSAGANLALAAALALRDRGAILRPAGLLSNYGFFDADFETATQRRFGDPGAMLTRDELAAFLDNYLGPDWSAPSPLALPILADLANLPPSFHVIAECDPLADGDRAMVERLRAAGSRTDSVVYPGATHSFLEAVSISALADRALADGAAWLRRTLAADASE
jgi:acetyl esterase